MYSVLSLALVYPLQPNFDVLAGVLIDLENKIDSVPQTCLGHVQNVSWITSF